MSYRAVIRVARTRATLRSRRLALQAVVLSRHHRRHPLWRQSHFRWLSASVEDDVSVEKSDEPLKNENDDEYGMKEERDRMIDEIRKLLEENVDSILIEKPIVKEKWKRILRRRRRERQRQSSVFLRKSIGESEAGLASKALHETEPSSVEDAVLGVHDAYDSQAEASPQYTADQVGAGYQNPNDNTTEDTVGSAEKDTRDKNHSLLDILRQRIEEETFFTPEISSNVEGGTNEAVSEPFSLLSLLNDESTLLESVQPPVSLLDLLNTDSVESTLDERSHRNESSPLFELLQQPIEEESFAIEGSTVPLTSSHETSTDVAFQDEPLHNKQSSLFDLLNEPIEDESWTRDTNDAFQGGIMDDEPSSLLDLLQEPIKDETSNEIVDEGLALLLALRGPDWSDMEGAYESDELLSTQEDDAIAEESVIEGGFVEENLEMEMEPEQIKEERIYDDGGHRIRNDDAGLEDVTVLLDQAGDGAVILSTADYNVLLLSIATSMLQTDDTLMLMIRTYRQMLELGEAGVDCAPDASTFTILMITLDRRAKAPLSAIDICRQMIASRVELNSEALAEGITCLEKRNRIEDTERLMNLGLSDQNIVPRKAWLILLDMYKNENLQEGALVLVEKCIEVNGERDDDTITKVLLEAISWPRRNRGGGRVDRSLFLTKVLHLLESCGRRATVPQQHEYLKYYDPPFSIWRRTILALASEIDRETGSGWSLVYRALGSMRNSVEHFWPDSLLLKTGLQASQVIGDAELAVDLVLRVHEKQMIDLESTSLLSGDKVDVGNGHLIPSSAQSSLFEPVSSFSDDGGDANAKTNISGASSLQLDIDAGEEGDELTTMNAQTIESIFPSEHSGNMTSDELGQDDVNTSPSIDRKSVRVPIQALSSAMRLCVATGDMDSAERLLDSLRDSRNTIPLAKKIELFTLALKGYAKTGNSDGAKALLKDMQNRGLNPTEETYGTVILSLAVAKKTEEACSLFKAMESGQFGDDISPGVACYNALMLTHIEAHQWDEALECHSRRKDAGLPYSTASFQDVLLASYRVGRKTKAAEAIEEALQSELKINYRCVDLSLQILLGDTLNSKTVDQARRRLREIGEESEHLKKPALNLSRSLRSAQVEEKRQPIKALKEHEIATKQEHAWRVALEHLVEFSRAMEEAKDAHVTPNDSSADI